MQRVQVELAVPNVPVGKVSISQEIHPCSLAAVHDTIGVPSAQTFEQAEQVTPFNQYPVSHMEQVSVPDGQMRAPEEQPGTIPQAEQVTPSNQYPERHSDQVSKTDGQVRAP